MNNKNNYMSSEIFFLAHEFILKELKKLMQFDNNIFSTYAFFGGEPLLNWKLIKNVTPKIKNELKIIPTNGTLLTQKKIDFLLENNYNISISFDGYFGNTHNRVLKSNRSETTSFFNNLHWNHMRKKGCKVMLYPNIFPEMTNILQDFNNRGILFPDFTLVRDDIYTENDIKIYDFNISLLSKYVLEKFKNGILTIPGIFTLYILDTILASKQGKRPFGCFAGTHGVGIMPNGKIYPCARFGSHQMMEIADVYSGKINKDIIYFFHKIHNPQNYTKCKKCKLYNVCNAGCSYSQLKNGKWEKMEPIESVCELLKISYRESYKIFTKLKNEKQFIDYLNYQIKNGG